MANDELEVKGEMFTAEEQMKQQLLEIVGRSKSKVISARRPLILGIIENIRQDTLQELVYLGNTVVMMAGNERMLCGALFLELFNNLDALFDIEVVGKDAFQERYLQDMLSDVVKGIFQYSIVAEYKKERLTGAGMLALIKEIVQASRDYSKREFETLFASQHGEIEEFVNLIVMALIEYHKIDLLLIQGRSMKERPPSYIEAFFLRYLTVGRYFEIVYDLVSPRDQRFRDPKLYIQEQRVTRGFGMFIQFADDLEDVGADYLHANVNPLVDLFIFHGRLDLIEQMQGSRGKFYSKFRRLEATAPEVASEANRLFKIAVGVPIKEAEELFENMGVDMSAFY